MGMRVYVCVCVRVRARLCVVNVCVSVGVIIIDYMCLRAWVAVYNWRLYQNVFSLFCLLLAIFNARKIFTVCSGQSGPSGLSPWSENLRRLIYQLPHHWAGFPPSSHTGVIPFHVSFNISFHFTSPSTFHSISILRQYSILFYFSFNISFHVTSPSIFHSISLFLQYFIQFHFPPHHFIQFHFSFTISFHFTSPSPFQSISLLFSFNITSNFISPSTFHIL